ncbi:hypothetical protein C8Q80DRAFT_1219255 [Daedaleopsis nitida]|nr:hypothetical protein C8Q80DRAFT_1219255 [Daedaleopsis nitida]
MSDTSRPTSDSWKVSIASDWAVLGPFPVHAREQHYISPSFPLDLSRQIDYNATYSSSYADGGLVGWTKAAADSDGRLEVTFPHIRWEYLRATEGWAALQHHSILRTTITVYPLHSALGQETAEPRLAVNLIQGSFFTLRPKVDPAASEEIPFVPEWHSGNIYDMGRSPPNIVTLPISPSAESPTTYEVFVSGDYEIRLFGDPLHEGSNTPKLSISLTVDIEHDEQSYFPVARDESHDVLPDFVDGWAFGDAIGLGLRGLEGWWTVVGIRTSAVISDYVELSLVQETRIAPTQTRIVPFRLTQTKPVSAEKIEFTLKLRSGDMTSEILVTIPVQHQAQWTSTEVPSAGIKASYFFSTSMPTLFVVSPPKDPNGDTPSPPILALHGAGVDVIAMDFWIKALPRQRHSWLITPTGRTAWGLDWHGPSARDAFATVEALHTILNAREEWSKWGLAPQTKVLLFGHSNGGQGAWFNAARNPDRVIGVVPAAGYIKSQAYVQWALSRSAHYIDPALRAILDSSLTADDNDLFLSNLVDTPILAIHGGDDDNVPVWHTREAVSVLKTWNPQANVTYREDPGQPHWYDTIFASDQVQSFVSKTLQESDLAPAPASTSFTLTVAIPADSGSLHGWSIHRLHFPGRLARLSIDFTSDAIRVRTTNAKAFSVRIGSLPADARNKPFLVDGHSVELDDASWELPDFTLGLAHDDEAWIPYAASSLATAPPTGRIANFLTTSGPMVIVVPSLVPSRLVSAALRIAHNLNVYHKLDADIIEDAEAALKISEGTLGTGNLLILGSGVPGELAQSMLRQGKTSFSIRDRALELRGRSLNAPSSATLFLHPHPIHANSLALFLHGSDDSGLESALRLFPIRTGVTVPDWIVIGPDADERGSGGVQGAGVWGDDWSWNEVMSAF